MSSSLENSVEQAYARLNRRRAELAEVQQALSTEETTVTAKNRAVAVTVDSRGAVATIKFPTGAYRSMAAAELGRLLVETIETARERALARTVAHFETLMPAGMPVLDLLTGATGDTGGPSGLDEMVRVALREAGLSDD